MRTRIYPQQLFDSAGVITKEALDYLKNWSTKRGREGIYFLDDSKRQDLLNYISEIWAYPGIFEVFEDEYEEVTLHLFTLREPNNEMIMEALVHTDLWVADWHSSNKRGEFKFKWDKL